MEKVKKETARDEFIRKSGNEEYELSWDDKGIEFKKKSEKKKGKKSRAAGSRFELKVRRDLEDKERIVDKWSNNVDLENDTIIPVKRRFIRKPLGPAYLMGVSTIGTGFPDFISIKRIYEGVYSVIGVEVKMNGILSKIEKEKCAWYLRKGIFSAIWIAKANREGRKIKIEYDDFQEKYGKKYNKA
jgi:hypothetical protein